MSHAGRRWSLVAGALLALLGAVAVAVYPGIYNVAADVPHTQPVYWLFETARDRSIGARARNIVVPNDLSDPARISSGAGQYAEMCAAFAILPRFGAFSNGDSYEQDIARRVSGDIDTANYFLR